MQLITETHLTSTFDHLIRSIDQEISSILDRALSGNDISATDAVKLFDCTGLEMNMLVLVADELRRRTVGDVVTYVVNRTLTSPTYASKDADSARSAADSGRKKGTICLLRRLYAELKKRMS